MSEEIKSNIVLKKVWVRDYVDTILVERWLIVDSGNRVVSNVDHSKTPTFSECFRTTTFKYIVFKDPKEKKCELLEDDEKLWEYSDGHFNDYDLSTVYGEFFQRLKSFVVELGNGKQKVVSDPIRWTGEKGSGYDGDCYNYPTLKTNLRCKIIGAIMSKD